MERQLCVGAIVRNEAPYLLEWIAFHLEQGFQHFYIGDNDSDDGTTELLEGLEELGHVTRLFQPRSPELRPQYVVYRQIVEMAAAVPSLVAFIDADEFLVPTFAGDRAGSAIRELMAPEEVGGLALHWRMFGSGGRVEPGDGLVIERFMHCSEPEAPSNLWVKSVVKPELVERAFVHKCILQPRCCYVDADGVPRPFAGREGADDEIQPIDGRLRLHHYVVKSFREFERFKAHRGSAAAGMGVVKDLRYFRRHDENARVNHRAAAFADVVRRRMDVLAGALTAVGVVRPTSVGPGPPEPHATDPPRLGGVLGWVDGATSDRVHGWACRLDGDDPVEVAVVAGGARVATQVASLPRPDLVETHRHRTGRCGFDLDLAPGALDHASPLEVRIVGTDDVLPGPGPQPGRPGWPVPEALGPLEREVEQAATGPHRASRGRLVVPDGSSRPELERLLAEVDASAADLDELVVFAPNGRSARWLLATGRPPADQISLEDLAEALRAAGWTPMRVTRRETDIETDVGPELAAGRAPEEVTTLLAHPEALAESYVIEARCGLDPAVRHALDQRWEAESALQQAQLDLDA